MYEHNYVFDYRTVTRQIDPITSVSRGLPYITAEVLVIYFILRPNSFRYSLSRSLTAFLVCAAWTVYLAQYVMHSAGWYISHVWWLIVVSACLLLLVLICLVAKFLRSKPSKP